MIAQTTSDLHLITTFLSIGVVIVPIIFGAAMFKMTSTFVTRELFEAYKNLAEVERTNLKDQLTRIERKQDDAIRSKND